METQTAFVGASGIVVLDSKSTENSYTAVVLLQRQFDADFPAGVEKHLADCPLKPELLASANEEYVVGLPDAWRQP